MSNRICNEEKKIQKKFISKYAKLWIELKGYDIYDRYLQCLIICDLKNKLYRNSKNNFAKKFVKEICIQIKKNTIPKSLKSQQNTELLQKNILARYAHLWIDYVGRDTSKGPFYYFNNFYCKFNDYLKNIFDEVDRINSTDLVHEIINKNIFELDDENKQILLTIIHHYPIKMYKEKIYYIKNLMKFFKIKECVMNLVINQLVFMHLKKEGYRGMTLEDMLKKNKYTY